nr:MAG TPA: hypothetical protein [Crassvirales sp.]
MVYHIISPTLCHNQRHVKKKKRSNRITEFTGYIVRLNSAFSLIGPQKGI